MSHRFPKFSEQDKQDLMNGLENGQRVIPIQDLIEEIIDIIDSENSGLSAEQRLLEIKGYIKSFNTKE
jgi:hypothetical protein